MTKPERTTEAGRCMGDGGAILAEMGLIMPVFVVFIFGIIEFGGLFRNYLTVSNASAAGGRSAAIAANDADADYQTLNAIKKASTAMPTSQIKKIVIYHAANSTTGVPTGCKSAASSGTGSPNWTNACNIYTGTDLLTLSASGFGCGNTPPKPDRYWCPTDRRTKLSGPESPPDYLGIWIEAEHPWVTGLFGKKITFDYTTVVKLEPQGRA